MPTQTGKRGHPPYSTLAVLAFAILAVAGAAPLFAQSVVSAELMRQLKNDKNAASQLNKALQKKDLTSRRDSLLWRRSALTDSAALRQDSLDRGLAVDSSTLAQDTVKGVLSVYEEMFQGKGIFPDSLIPYLRPYGSEFFSQKRRHDIGPGDMSSAPGDYPVRAGDELKVHLWGRINEEYALTVSREGTVTIPHNVGPVTVAGLSYGSVQRVITDKLKNIEGVNVSLSMGELRPIGIYIVGEVNSPGFHTVSPLTSVANALFVADGITRRGSMRNVSLKRGGKTVAEIDFYDFLMSGSDKSGLRLQAGDVISVPIARQMIGVVGNVRRSAIYELKKPEKLSETLELAGGVSPAGWMGRVQVERFEDNMFHTVLDADASGALPDFIVKDGDLIKVFPVLSMDRNTVYLSGNVLRPGKYGYKSGMRVRDLIGDHRDLMPETYFEYAVILRKTYPSYLNRIVPFNLGKALSDAASADNLRLEEQDEIIIYNNDHFNPDRNVTIEGAVTAPGAYKLMDNMTLRDLILQAGGLSDDASKERGELYRRRVEGESVVTAKIEFSIDKAMHGDAAHNAILARNDKIFIRSMKGWESERSVRLSGQINYPGTYVAFEGESLGDLIKRAGGFKPDAYLPAAVFTRRSVKAMEESRIKMYNSELSTDMVRLSMEMASKGVNILPLSEQQMALRQMLDSVTVLGRVMLDMTDEDHYGSFALEDGDELFIPRNLSTVSVLGEVYNPGTFMLDAKKPTVARYIDITGGPKETADRKAIYIIRANGNVVSNKTLRVSSINLEPGDVVIVPAKLRYNNNFKLFVDSADATLKIGSFLTAVVTLIIVINTAANGK
jgi:protein involved in polysaccharide export with SLBB domain